MYKASLYLLGCFGILGFIRHYSTNEKYTITLLVAQALILLCGAYCLWYDWNVNRVLKKHLRLLFNRRKEILKQDTPSLRVELDLNFAYRMARVLQLHNQTYYKKHHESLHASIYDASYAYIFINKIYK